MIGIVDLSGGFGNHLFQYSFALYLKKYGVKVFLYNPEKKYYFNCKDFNLNELNYFFLINFKLLKKFKFFYKYYKIFTSHEILEKKLKIEDFYLNSKIVSFNGFFQDYNLVVENFSEIKSNLIKNIENPLNKDEVPNGNTLIHVRRTDYLEQKEELSIDYYIKAISYCEENIKDFTFDVYTDDYEWVSQQNIFKKAQYIEKSENILERKEEAVNSVFRKMMKYNNYIIANSTYSWWAAILNESSSSVIVQPEPFYKWVTNANLLVPNWIKIARK